ncbi:hypothetical protein OZ411_38530 [Bradyrhizobium sp. Arg237L]|uniref:hypothetical protein n=1 Tax=Bradyrhizobium sp. Arg237L TaxID=3003352 RepID=UPI00249E9FAA|nr:hypothetical protein [Bradyrhizobium sp. Arg237L]MDI4238698.1 hypothetical protein [Bradyrhizobium sp. Arg237L]
MRLAGRLNCGRSGHRGCTDSYCFEAVQRPTQQSDWRKLPEPERLEMRPVLIKVIQLAAPFGPMLPFWPIS